MSHFSLFLQFGILRRPRQILIRRFPKAAFPSSFILKSHVIKTGFKILNDCKFQKNAI